MIAPGKMVLAVVLAGALTPFGGTAHRRTEEGNRRYVEKAYDEALRAYTEAQVELPEAPELFYDIGNVLYRQGDLEGAEEAWTRALAAADDDLVADIAHNLGNARYGRQAYQEAVEAYRQALGARPEDRDTKRNLELALRELQAQQQQQQQQDEESQEEKDESEQDQTPKDRTQETGQPPEKSQDSRPKPSEAGMTREEAERLLDGLEAEEKDTLKEEEARRKAQAGNRREKDW
jgi:tetratricopeptide (TPR) repeat protein